MQVNIYFFIHNSTRNLILFNILNIWLPTTGGSGDINNLLQTAIYFSYGKIHVKEKRDFVSGLDFDRSVQAESIAQLGNYF